MLAFSALVAGSFALGRLAAPHITPEALTAMRFAIAAATLAGLAFWNGGFPRSAFAAPWRYVLLAALYITYFVTMFEGLKTAQPVSMAAVFTLTPPMTALLGWLLLRQVTTPRMALALSIGAVGALWVIFRGDLAALIAFQPGRGEAIYFWGCICHAAYLPFVKRLSRGEPALAFNALVLFAGVGLLVLWGGRSMIETDWAALPAIVWITILYTAFAATAITVTLLRFAALRLPGAKVMAYTYLTPTWVIGWQLALAQPAAPLRVLGGVALTMVALWLMLRNDSAADG